MSADFQARAREIAAGLNPDGREALRAAIEGESIDSTEMRMLQALGLTYVRCGVVGAEQYGVTDLASAVAAVLASGEVGRG